VVSVREAQLRHGPLEESASFQTLTDGQELLALDQNEGWIQVSGASRGVGWVKRDQVLLLGR